MTCNKIDYQAKEEAAKDAKRILINARHFKDRVGNKKAGKKQTAYECPLCGLWHLTTLRKTKFKPKSVRA